MEGNLTKRYLKVAGVVALYWFVSISMVFVNKYLLGGQSGSGDKDAPLFVTFFQCVVTALACIILSKLSNMFPKVFTAPKSVFHLEIAKKVLPLSIVFVGMITFNNLCLMYVGVPFYYVGRSLTTVFNVILSYFMLGLKTSRQALICVLLIILGFLLGVDQQSAAESFTWTGVFYGILASLFVALNAIYTKKVLPVVDGSIWQLSFYNNVLACILFLPLMVIFGEIPKIFVLFSERDSNFWLLMVVAGLFGFAIGYVASLQIQVTSPLTHMVSGTAKACLQTVIATWWYLEQKASLWWCSNWIVLIASMGYSYVRMLEMKTVTNMLPTVIKPGKC